MVMGLMDDGGQDRRSPESSTPAHSLKARLVLWGSRGGWVRRWTATILRVMVL